MTDVMNNGEPQQGGFDAARGPETVGIVAVERNESFAGGVRGGRAAPLEATMSTAREFVPEEGFWLPQWVRALVGNQVPIEDIVNRAIERVTEQPTHDRLVETMQLFNELSRNPAHAQVIRSLYPTEFVTDLTRGNQR
ncbi:MULTISPECIES: hypothetical protein [unclassified Nocardia]|uniref:hypothetical protein n=1 Tax=unclassified Nocardia TaxID=2637762 RepID=UPI001CE40B7B|nr:MULTISPECIES: hypothetical protein [unclassified Nocardia]